MTEVNLDFSRLDADEAADLPSATYFTLENLCDYTLASIEEAEEGGTFSVHLGVPHRPDHRHAFKFPSLVEALKALTSLKAMHPGAAVWLSCEEIMTPIMGDNLFRGLVAARASLDPGDDLDEWNEFAEAIAKGDAKGRRPVVSRYAPPLFRRLAKHL